MGIVRSPYCCGPIHSEFTTLTLLLDSCPCSQFMCAAYGYLMDSKSGALVVGGDRLLELSKALFGTHTYCLRSIRDAVMAARRNGLLEPPLPNMTGRPTSLPREIESVIFKFLSKLRTWKCPVYKSTASQRPRHNPPCYHHLYQPGQCLTLHHPGDCLSLHHHPHSRRHPHDLHRHRIHVFV